MPRVFRLYLATALLLAGFSIQGKAQNSTVQKSPYTHLLNCALDLGFCQEQVSHLQNGAQKYIGHDEPSIVFYSNVPGSGNSAVYLLTLPLDPPTPPVQDGGGTFNFQLHPAFWFGMNLCDSQSYPEFTDQCQPDTDENIFDDVDGNSPRFIGKHPGTAFLELQFYPPGWIDSPGIIDSSSYFAALNIDSFDVNGATGVPNNAACADTAGLEPVNFAILTANGVPLTPPNPLGVNFGQNNFNLNNVVLMSPGDQILVIVNDTGHGVETIIQDLTSGQSGFMVASAANGFGQILYQPNSATCNVAPYDFHAMYSTSSEHARTPWSIGNRNTTFSDELGHFEFCDQADPNTLNCLVPGIEDRNSGLDADDVFCFSPGGPFVPGPPFIQVGGCIAADLDFDGTSYGFNWPGTFANVQEDQQLHPQPIRITSPLFLDPLGLLQSFPRVAFENDIPDFDPNCNEITGAGCSTPAQGMAFYPFYTTTNSPDGICRWQFGGGLIPGTTNNFGGNPTAAWGQLFAVPFQTGPNTAAEFFTNFRRTLAENPCGASVSLVGDNVARLLHP